jgi:pimeloyl-ACP methyl ester carboxylesterase
MAGKPDLLTDLRGAVTTCGDLGPVHKGFKATFDSAMIALAHSDTLIRQAHVVHCVGHSLGGAVATLVAAQYAGSGKAVRLYTFGSPRVGAFTTYATLQDRIGKANIYRVAHDLDPISLVGPFPFIHVNPLPADLNNMTIPSPTGSLFGFANHDMNRYITSVSRAGDSWESIRRLTLSVDHDEAVLARWLLHPDNDPGWIQVASAKTLGILFKLFRHVLRGISTSLVLGLTAIDLLAEMLVSGMYRAKALGEQIFQLLRFAAQWAGITLASGAEFTAGVIRAILMRMLDTLRALTTDALANPTRFLRPLPLALAGGAALLAINAF